MKASYIIIFVSAFILLALMATNPSIEDHRQAVKDKLRENIGQMASASKFVRWKKSASDIGLIVGYDIVDRVISRKSYILFSVTQLLVDGKEMNIGVGIFSSVFIDDYERVPEVNISKNRNSVVPEVERQSNNASNLEAIPFYADRESKVLYARQRFKECNAAVSLVNTVDFNCSSNGGDPCKARVFKNDRYGKVYIDFGFLNGSARTKLELYYDQGDLFFMYKTIESRDQLQGNIIKYEQRIYVENNSVYKYMINQDIQTSINRGHFGSADPELTLYDHLYGRINTKVLCDLAPAY